MGFDFITGRGAGQYALRESNLAFYVFTGIVFSVGPPVAWSFCFTFLPAFSFRNDLRGRGLSVLRFCRHSLFGTTSGGHIFLCVKKDMEERHAKGLQSRPLESCFYTGVWRGDVRTFLRVRIGAINAI